MLLFHDTIVRVHVLLSNFMDQITVLGNLFFYSFSLTLVTPHFLLFLSVYFSLILSSIAIDPPTLI